MSIQLKRSLSSDIDPNYILKQGQIGIEMLKDTNKSSWGAGTSFYRMKIGDGINKWSDLKTYVDPNHYQDRIICFDNNSWTPLEFRNYGPRASISFQTYNSNSVSTQFAMGYWNDDIPRWFSYDKNATLGISNYPWGSIYCTTGTIQTSSRSEKYNIHYLEEPQVMSADVDSADRVSAPTLETILNFINTLNTASFIYKSSDNPDDDPNKAQPELVQLGLIAEDIEDDPLFPYIGTKVSWEATEAQILDDGTVVREASPAGSSLSLKPLPLAVCALTACKYLLQRNELLEERIDALEQNR